jgi:hypothetical protein
LSATNSKNASRKASAKQPQPPPSSEDDDYTEDATPDEESEDDFISDDEQVIKTKLPPKRAKSLPVKKRSASISSAGTDGEAHGDSMDIDGPATKPSTKKNPKKRKADNDQEAPVKKQKRREEGDPWKLLSRSVQNDWTQMQAPPFEMFHFARKVVDEYTYLYGKILAMVTKITADRHWVLSGTPPIHDFGALKTIAAFLNLHLGVDDDGEGQSIQVKKRRREQTGQLCLVHLFLPCP